MLMLLSDSDLMMMMVIFSNITSFSLFFPVVLAVYLLTSSS
jgi:hypothetical protein